jgi:hypothetical protein
MTRNLNAGVPPGASATRYHHNEAFPWRRTEGVCELCGDRADMLAWIEVDPGGKVDGGYRLRRTVLACGRHVGGLTNGKPVATPRTSTAAGTSREYPQSSQLFDSFAFKRRVQ